MRDLEKSVAALKENSSRTRSDGQLEARFTTRKKPDEARRLMQSSSGRRHLARLAALCEQLDLYDDAGRLYQAAGTIETPGRLAHVRCLPREASGNRGRDRAMRRGPPPLELFAVARVRHRGGNSLCGPKPTGCRYRPCHALIDEGLQKANGQPAVTADLLHHQAAIHSLRHEYDKAIAQYQRVLDLRPNKDVAKDVVALTLNNLAYLLAAHKHEVPSADKPQLEAAEQTVGPIPELLDTEALVRLKQAPPTRESVQAAITLLEDVEVQRASTVTYFHLALARLALSDWEKEKNPSVAERVKLNAQVAWEEARNGGNCCGGICTHWRVTTSIPYPAGLN